VLPQKKNKKSDSDSAPAPAPAPHRVKAGMRSSMKSAEEISGVRSVKAFIATPPFIFHRENHE
jgi:hypothetical protein